MSADIHPLQPGSQPIEGERSVYLDAYLAPFRPWLDRDTVTEIMVNRPGEVWIEDAADPGMKRIETPQIDDRLVQRLAEQVARVSHQGINREHPLLGKELIALGMWMFGDKPLGWAKNAKSFGVVISDSFGRAWRRGTAGIAIGAAGAGLGAAAQETVLQAAQETRTPAESAQNIGTAMLFGAKVTSTLIERKREGGRG